MSRLLMSRSMLPPFSVSKLQKRFSGAVLFPLDASLPDHFRPLVGIFHDELFELSGRTGERRIAQVDDASLDSWIIQACVDLSTEVVNNLGRGISRRADALPTGRLIARHDFGNGR